MFDWVPTEGCFDAYLARLNQKQQHLGVAVDIGLTASSMSELSLLTNSCRQLNMHPQCGVVAVLSVAC